MCGRFMLNSDAAAIATEFGVAPAAELEPRYNIAPSQPVLIVRAADPGRAAVEVRWGLVPAWAKDLEMGHRLINARSETAAEKPAFRAAFRRRRCLVPADGYYEWQSRAGGKQPYFIHAATGGCFGIAGLWERWQNGELVVESCALLTCAANRRLREVHDRMPVIIRPDDYNLWLDDATEPSMLAALLKPAPESSLDRHPVSKRVNSPRNDSIECIAPDET
jgi:putative SOS response-associated peptidase YedK